VEGAWAIAKNKLVSVSEQELVDCSKQNNGCDGGLMDYAFQDIISMGGLESEKDYPYTAQDGTCKFDKSKVVVTISSYKDVTPNDNNALMSALAQQPVSVAINAASTSFQFYSGGVYDDASCPSDSSDLDHGVLAVGYGTMNGKDYFKVKNSWGAGWGSSGFIYMARGPKVNQCGILDVPSYPVV
jgi:C1A family cysteine protease